MPCALLRCNRPLGEAIPGGLNAPRGDHGGRPGGTRWVFTQSGSFVQPRSLDARAHRAGNGSAEGPTEVFQKSETNFEVPDVLHLGGTCAHSPSGGGCSCLKYPCGKVWEKGLMKWQHGILSMVGLGTSTGRSRCPGKIQCLHFVAVHTPRFYNWILVWHYIAPHPGDRHLTRRLESGACPVLEAHQRSSFDNTVQAPARKNLTARTNEDNLGV